MACGQSPVGRYDLSSLSALVQRRQRADLTMCWKLLHGKLNQSHAELLTLAGDRLSGPSTRSNGYKLAVQRSRLDVRKFFFSCRVARVWNRLPAIVVSSNTVAAFKVRLDELQPPQACFCEFYVGHECLLSYVSVHGCAPVCQIKPPYYYYYYYSVHQGKGDK